MKKTLSQMALLFAAILVVSGPAFATDAGTTVEAPVADADAGAAETPAADADAGAVAGGEEPPPARRHHGTLAGHGASPPRLRRQARALSNGWLGIALDPGAGPRRRL